jgi:hypothetical protein
MEFELAVKLIRGELEDCPICQEPILDPRILRCNHKYHNECIEKHFASETQKNEAKCVDNTLTCPMCRNVERKIPRRRPQQHSINNAFPAELLVPLFGGNNSPFGALIMELQQ